MRRCQTKPLPNAASAVRWRSARASSCRGIAGLVRTRVIAHYLGQTRRRRCVRPPRCESRTLLQNLFGEGVLSASFIPVYARLRAEGRDADASRVARAVGTLLALVALRDHARSACSRRARSSTCSCRDSTAPSAS